MKKQNRAKKALKKSENPAEAKRAAEVFTSKDNVKTDPLGSWTGNPADLDDVPTQDVDDL